MNKDFVYPVPSFEGHRNKFDMSFNVKTAINHGECVPLKILEVLPGDSFKIDMGALVRMSTPIAPLMDNISFHVACYWVPSRILYEKTEQVFGANKDGAWINEDGTPNMPFCSSDSVLMGEKIKLNSIGDYLGLPIGVDIIGSSGGISAMPGRAYYTVWNEFYRNQNVSAPVPVSHGTEDIIVYDDDLPSNLKEEYNNPCMPLGKFSDLFTKCLPQAQKGAPVPFIPDDLDVFGIGDSDITYDQPVVAIGVDEGEQVLFKTSADDDDVNISLKADVNKAWNTISNLRLCFQLQKYFEKDAHYGSRYFEYLIAHYGCKIDSNVVQRPEFLGEINFHINIDQVLSTSDYSETTSTKVGKTGANSVTAKKGWLCTKSFLEHGYLLIVGGARATHTYGQGFEKLWMRSDRFDFYDPLFSRIGDMPVRNYQIFATDTGADPQAKNLEIFGYQEAFAEYKFIPDTCTSIIRPDATGSLDFWTLADKFAETPVLNEEFIYENRDNIKRALVTGETGPDYICDFYFKTIAVREIPLYSIPGLADH